MPAPSIGPSPNSRPDAAGAADEFSPRAKNSAVPRVLVVDDEPLVRWAVTETLKSHGYEIEEAADAEGAIRAVRYGAAPPDVVLLDLRLPDCSDLRLMQAIRRCAPEAPIILMTAFSTPEVRDEAARLGAYCVVEKPFEVGSLDSLVARALAS
jgi:DNA-binding NtrC family response regulator